MKTKPVIRMDNEEMHLSGRASLRVASGGALAMTVTAVIGRIPGVSIM